MRHFFLLILALAFLQACRNHKNPEIDTAEIPAEPAPVTATVEAAPPPTEDAAPQRESKEPDTFRVVVSMISIGEGTDPDGPSKLEKFLKQYHTETGTTVSYSMQPWGREGEVDYNFPLRGMTAAEQADFVSRLQAAMKDEKLIRVTENKANRFKR
jgi:hypothetical protein